MYALLKVIPLFCTTHPLPRITLRHPRWRGFFPLARKEQTMVSFAELKLLFAIIMPQIGWQLPGLLSKNKKMKEMCVIPKSAVVFHFAAVELWNYSNVLAEALDYEGCESCGTALRLSNCINEPVPGLGSALYTYVVQTPRVERRIFLKQIETHWNCNKRKSLLAFNNNTTNKIRMKIYCNRRAWYLK